MIRDGKGQANHFILYLDQTPLDNLEIDRQINNIFRSKYTKFVEAIIVLKWNDIKTIKNKEL